MKVCSDDVSIHHVATEINTERLKLHSEIGIWQDDQALYMPEVLKYASESLLVEDEALFLPSELTHDHRNTSWFMQLAKFELDLCKGQAEDALSLLCLALKYQNSLQHGR